MKISTKNQTKGSNSMYHVSDRTTPAIVETIKAYESKTEEPKDYSVVTIVETVVDLDQIVQEAQSSQFVQDIPSVILSSSIKLREEQYEEILDPLPPLTSSAETPVRERTFSSGEEEILGDALSEAEKPRILASVSKNVSRGFPTSIALFIKKFTSQRGILEKYTILRKEIFKDSAFSVIAELTPTQVASSSSPENLEMLKSLGLDPRTSFVFEDRDINSNSVYVYRVSVKWRLRNDTDDDLVIIPFFFNYSGSMFV